MRASAGAGMSARIGGMKLTPTERAKRANAALTTEQRSAAGKARAAILHDPLTKARAIAKVWEDLTDEKRRAIRSVLREAGIVR